MNYKLVGTMAELTVNDTGVHIKGIKLGNKTDKTIPFSQIVSIRIQKPSFVQAGYIHFQTVGSAGSSRLNSIVNYAADENAVLFKKDGYEAAVEIKEAVEKQISG